MLLYLSCQSVPWLGTSHGEQSSLQSDSKPVMCTLVSIVFYEEHGSDILVTHCRLLGALVMLSEAILLLADKAQLPYPLLTGKVLQPSRSPWCTLNSFQFINVCPVLGTQH